MNTIDNKLHREMKALGDDKFYIELIENYPCTTKEELHKREGEYIREIGTLNYQVSGRTRQQYREENREKEQLRHKVYYENNHEKELARTQKYRENNRDKEQVRARKYYDEHREENRIKRAEIVKCECGAYVNAVHSLLKAVYQSIREGLYIKKICEKQKHKSNKETKIK